MALLSAALSSPFAGAVPENHTAAAMASSPLVEIRILGPEWICAVVDPTESILADRVRRFGPLPGGVAPDDWRRIRPAERQIGDLLVELRTALDTILLDPRSWRIDGVPPAETGLWVQSTGAFPDPDLPDTGLGLPRLVRYVYLRTPGTLVPGDHILSGPGIPRASFRSGGTDVVCHGLKVNQEGYLPEGPKIARFGMWLGTRGAMATGGLPGSTFHILDLDTAGTPSVFTGTVRFRSVDAYADTKGLPISGEEVCELDFSAFRREGRFAVHLPGIGRSWPFRIGAGVYGPAFRTVMRALYHQRCGVRIDGTRSGWPRELCHPVTFAGGYPPDDGRIYGNPAGIREGGELYGFRDEKGTPVAIDVFTAVRSTSTTRIVPGVSGGRHDAADYDRRIRHLEIVWDLCGVQELFPDHFTDGQLGIPESGDGIPDILDEAAVDVDLWMKAQTHEGGVPGWIEQRAHPSRTTLAAQDVEPSYLSLPDRSSSYAYAAAAALLSRRLRPYAPGRAAAYLASARRAYDWAGNQENRITGLVFTVVPGPGRSALDGRRIRYDEAPSLSRRALLSRLLATIQLAAASGGPPLPGALVDELVGFLPDEVPVYALATPLFGTVFSEADRARLAQAVLREARVFREGSERLPYRTLWREPGHRYFTYMAWGRGQGAYRGRMQILAWLLTGERAWRDTALMAADQELGANELGTSFTTGLGSVYPAVLQHIQSDRDGIDDPVPGITPFGLTFGIAASAKRWLFPAGGALLPETDYPVLRRRFIHPFLEPSQNEFTVMESVGPRAAFFGAFVAPGWTPPAGSGPERPRPPGPAILYPQP